MLSVAGIFLLGYFGLLQNEYLTSFLIQIVVMFAMPMLLYTLFVSKNFKKTFKDAGFKSVSFRVIIISICLGVILYFFNSFVSTFWSSFISMFGYESLGGTTNIKLDYAFLLKEFILSAILPGICEEFLHRGIMLHSAKKTSNPRYCLLISSILFGLTHLNINQFFYATILGALMGYVSLIADSIYPSIIIHFMNNFLSTFFFYGYYMDLPLAKFVREIELLLTQDLFLMIVSTLVGIILITLAFLYLVKKLSLERVKRDVKTIIKSLELEKLPIEQAQERINQANAIIEQSKNSYNIHETENTKLKFHDKVFVYSSIVLGAIITIMTFIWGII